MEINEIKFIINYLRESGNECEWIEVKETQIDEEKLGKTISDIANSCLIYEKEYGYIFIGIKDKTLAQIRNFLILLSKVRILNYI